MKRDNIIKAIAQWLLPLLFPAVLLSSVLLSGWSLAVILAASLTLMGVCQYIFKLVDKSKHPNWYGFLTMLVFWGIITIGGIQVHKAMLDSKEANKTPRFLTTLNGFTLNDLFATNTFEIAQQDGKYTLHVVQWNEGDALAEHVSEAVFFPVWIDATFPDGWRQAGAEYRPNAGTGDSGFKACMSPDPNNNIVHPQCADSFNMVISLTNQPPPTSFFVKFEVYAKGLQHVRVASVKLLPQ